jgi:hypothetical protein
VSLQQRLEVQEVLRPIEALQSGVLLVKFVAAFSGESETSGRAGGLPEGIKAITA